MAYCDEGVRRGAALSAAPQEKGVNLTELLSEYEEIEASLQALKERKQKLREILFAELSLQGIEETSVITATGTKFVLRVQKTRREKVDIKLLRTELGEKAERFIIATESEFLSIRPAKKTVMELKEENNGKDNDITF